MTDPSQRDLEMALEAWEAHGDIVERFAERIAAAREEGRRERGMTEPLRPRGSNADEWHLFLCQSLDNRATSPNGLTFMAVQIAEAIDAACEEGRREERARIMTILEQGSVYVSLDTDARLRGTTLRTSAT